MSPAARRGESIGGWLRYGRLPLTQARAIAGAWRAARRAGHDPVMEWDAQLAEERSRETARTAAIAAEAAQPTIRDVVEQFMAKHMAGKKSAPSIRYLLDRLTAILGDQKFGDVTRQNVIALIDDATVVRQILEHLGRWAPRQARKNQRAPPMDGKGIDGLKPKVHELTCHPVPDIA